ncbi:LOW QUALITY PROTEIN: M-phase phosphoprotein 6 [Rana temporaria]|uniref:LOW QUALITY PROTEIN: M-phase phosphoprotein 6 n=1 Tax=Rana temporaria TaxID=8407 RepID=UPI001AADB67F|nr:LOW QUALITY PROTEIN: M-phase phosphoprotein 6 [Rana temporaria]
MAAEVGKLSKNLLRMKFMQRSLDPETRRQMETEEKKIISDEHWFLDLPELKEKENFIIEERSLHPCIDFTYGRMSFKGFNPEVEKLMVEMNSPRGTDEDLDESKMEADVSDEEMARRYESLVGTIKKKFAKKRDHKAIKEVEVEDENCNIRSSKVKKGFMKPQD